jgi:hypothetical protein
MTGNDVIYEVGALMYVVLSKAEKHVPYEELSATTEYLTLQTRCRTDRSRCNRGHLYMLLRFMRVQWCVLY